MDVGIIGFAGSGKTTLFNALTGAKAETGGYSGREAEPNIAVVKVPDARVDRLVAFFEPKKVVPATITYIDVAGIQANDQAGGALDEKLINALANCDALLAVVQAFDQGGVKTDPVEGAEAIQAELLLSDLARVETRLERIGKQIGKLKAEQKTGMERERVVLDRCKEALEAEQPIRSLDFDEDGAKTLRAFQFMTEKPLLLVVNLPEDEIGNAEEVAARLREPGLPPGTAAVACCAQGEMEIAQIEDEAEREEFLADFGIEEPAAARIIRVSYETLGLISFFTAGPKEVHAWTLRKGESIARAAGTIHSDMERGFIRAEVIDVDDLVEAGSMPEARKQGKVRTEGKAYVTEDGDVIEIRFSV